MCMDGSSCQFQRRETGGGGPQPFIQQSASSMFASSFNRQYTRLKEGVGFFSSLLSRIKSIVNFIIFDRWVAYKESLDVSLAAEHLSGGNFPLLATRNTIALLKELEPRRQDLIDQLSFAETILSSFHDSDYTNPSTLVSKMVDVTRTKIGQMKKGDSIAIPSNVAKHSMMMRIICTGAASNGKKTYKVIQYNTGGGLDSYHFARRKDKKNQYQTGLEIDDVSEDALCGPTSSFLTDLYNLSKMNKRGDYFFSFRVEIKRLYEDILPQLKGTIVLPSTDDRLWQRAQEGGSCHTSCGLSLIRAQMSKEEYQMFKASARMRLAYKTYTQLGKGMSLSATRKIATLDAVRSLEKTAHKNAFSLPDDFVQMRQALEASQFNGELDPKKTSKNKDILEAEEFLKRTLSTGTLPDPLSEKEFKKIEILCDLVTSKNSDFPLDFQRTFNLTFFLTIVRKKLTDAGDLDLIFLVNPVAKIMHQRFRNLNIANKSFAKTFKDGKTLSVILDGQAEILNKSPEELIIPPGLLEKGLDTSFFLGLSKKDHLTSFLLALSKKDHLTDQEVGIVANKSFLKTLCLYDDNVIQLYSTVLRKCPSYLQKYVINQCCRNILSLKSYENRDELIGKYIINLRTLLEGLSFENKEDLRKLITELEDLWKEHKGDFFSRLSIS